MKPVITFEAFQLIVNTQLKHAEKYGLFEDCSSPEQILFEWISYPKYNYGFIIYDSENVKPWFIDQGYGARGNGETLAQAVANERENYLI